MTGNEIINESGFKIYLADSQDRIL